MATFLHKSHLQKDVKAEILAVVKKLENVSARIRRHFVLIFKPIDSRGLQYS